MLQPPESSNWTQSENVFELGRSQICKHIVPSNASFAPLLLPRWIFVLHSLLTLPRSLSGCRGQDSPHAFVCRDHLRMDGRHDVLLERDLACGIVHLLACVRLRLLSCLQPRYQESSNTIKPVASFELSVLYTRISTHW